MHKADETLGFVPVLAALAGNVFICLMKFGGFFVSGSGALFSEAVHSLADVSNQILLMIGIKRSTKKADEQFIYGYGRERFFWAVISACSIFFIGSGVTLMHGFESLVAKETIHITKIIFFILLTSLAIESYTFFLAWKELNSNGSGHKIKDLFKNGDPSTIAVLYEDGVAVLGVLVALLSVTLTKYTGEYYWDSFGSIVIGILLGLVAILLINKNRSYLIGRSMPSEMSEKIIDILTSDPTIEKIIDFKSVTLDVNIYRIKCEVEFNSPVLLNQIFKSGLKDEYEHIKNDYEEFIRFLADHTDRIPRLIGTKIDELEKRVRSKVPEVRHIDIEIN